MRMSMRSWSWMGATLALFAGCSSDDGGGIECNCSSAAPTSSQSNLCRCPPPAIDASADATTSNLDANTLLDAHSGDACLPLPCPPGATWNPNTCQCASDAGTACSPVGTYERGKGDTTPDCCPGLNQVNRLVMSYGADGTMTCGSIPIASFICIEGSCGDGICEPTEAEPCGCLADCPSAAFGSWDGGSRL